MRVEPQFLRAGLKKRSERNCERGGVDGNARIFDMIFATDEQRRQRPRPAARSPEVFSEHALRRNAAIGAANRLASFRRRATRGHPTQSSLVKASQTFPILSTPTQPPIRKIPT